MKQILFNLTWNRLFYRGSCMCLVPMRLTCRMRPVTLSATGIGDLFCDIYYRFYSCVDSISENVLCSHSHNICCSCLNEMKHRAIYHWHDWHCLSQLSSSLRHWWAFPSPEYSPWTDMIWLFPKVYQETNFFSEYHFRFISTSVHLSKTWSLIWLLISSPNSHDLAACLRRITFLNGKVHLNCNLSQGMSFYGVKYASNLESVSSYLEPVSVIVLKMSCTSDPAQCNNRACFWLSQVIPLAATYSSKLDFHQSHHWPTLVVSAPILKGWTPQSPLSPVVDIVSPQFTRQMMTCSFNLHFYSSPRCNIVF